MAVAVPGPGKRNVKSDGNITSLSRHALDAARAAGPGQPLAARSNATPAAARLRVMDRGPRAGRPGQGGGPACERWLRITMKVSPRSETNAEGCGGG